MLTSESSLWAQHRTYMKQEEDSITDIDLPSQREGSLTLFLNLSLILIFEDTKPGRKLDSGLNHSPAFEPITTTRNRHART